MANLRFWEDEVEIFGEDDIDTGTMETRWFCSDGISTFFGETKSEAASHFGVPVGFDDEAISNAASTLGRKGGSVKSGKKAAASRENGKKGGRPKKEVE